MPTRDFAEIEREEMSPERRRRIADRVALAETEILLGELRQQANMTQAELAAAMGISQPNVSKLEGEDDMRISTLRRIVEALGGKLRITVEMPGKGEFPLTQFMSQK
jgi:DNA-binding Xre family transcriptional regulator